MNEQSQRRLVGAIVVIVAIGIVSYFLLQSPQDLEQSISPPAEFYRFEVHEPPAGVAAIEKKLAEVKENRLKQEERIRQKEEAAQRNREQQQNEQHQQAVSEPKNAIKDSLDEVVFNEQGVPVRWVVQVVSYSNDANARKFRQQLTDEGFPVIMRSITGSQQRTFHVVYVGPVLRRSKAEEYKIAVDKAHNTQGIIKKWN